VVLGSWQQDIEVGVASAMMGVFFRSRSDACDGCKLSYPRGFYMHLTHSSSITS